MSATEETMGKTGEETAGDPSFGTGEAGFSGMDATSKQSLHDLAVVGVSIFLCFIAYWYINSSKKGGDVGDGSSFTVPKGIEEYAEFRDGLLTKVGSWGSTRGLEELELEERDALKKKLMQRAFQTIPIIVEQQEKGAVLERLYKKGMMPDNSTAIKNFIDTEIPDVQQEANAIVPGWGESIWAECMGFYQKFLKKKAEKEAGEESKDEKKEEGKPEPANT